MPTPAVAANSGDVVPSAATPVPQPSPSAADVNLRPEIYFERGSATGAAFAKTLEKMLREKGFEVQPPRNSGGGMLGFSEVKYYFPEDLSEAALLVRTLRDLESKICEKNRVE
jgi:hypothetical protein